jgi:hypothetical protein
MNRRMFLLSSASLAAATACQGPPEALVAQRGGANGIVPLTVSDWRVRVHLGWPDREGGAVAFDTGTSGNAIDMDFFNTSGLQRTGEALVTDGGTGQSIDAFETQIPMATLGGYPVGQLVASVYDYKPGDEVGIVGPNVFWKQLVFLEFGMQRLRIRSRTPDAIPTDAPFPYHELSVPNSRKTSCFQKKLGPTMPTSSPGL